MGIAWGLATGARALAAAVRGRGVPLQATLSVTSRCNRRCLYCSIPDHAVPELGTGEWREIMTLLRGAGTRRVLFFGGEPLLREDILALVEHARRIGLRVGLTTNGALAPQRVAVIRRLHALTVSLDGTQASQDRVRGSGSHADALRAVEIARECRVPVKVNAVLSAENAEDLPWLLQFTRERGLPLVLNFMRSEENGLHRDAVRLRLDDAGVRRLLRTIGASRRRHPQILFSSSTYDTAGRWHDFTVDRVTLRQGRKPPGPRCSAGRLHCAVSADGRVYPCPVTAGLVPALSVLRDGLGAALAQAASHDCVACSSLCMIETNALYALRPRVLLNHLTAVLNGQVY